MARSSVVGVKYHDGATVPSGHRGSNMFFESAERHPHLGHFVEDDFVRGKWDAETCSGERARRRREADIHPGPPKAGPAFNRMLTVNRHRSARVVM